MPHFVRQIKSFNYESAKLPTFFSGCPISEWMNGLNGWMDE